jgi:hypothetical protein
MTHRAPPVRQATLVSAPLERTFAVFVREIATWWPVRPCSAGQERVRDVTVEPRLEGRVYETWDDGTVVEWGTVTGWRPPESFAMSWLLTPEPTEVELTFRAVTSGLTRVAVEHRGWEALDDEQLGADCAAPGGYSSGAYASGWAAILAALAGACSDVRPDHEGVP